MSYSHLREFMVAFRMMRRAEPHHIKWAGVIIMVGVDNFGRTATLTRFLDPRATPEPSLNLFVSPVFFGVALFPVAVSRRCAAEFLSYSSAVPAPAGQADRSQAWTAVTLPTAHEMAFGAAFWACRCEGFQQRDGE